MGRCKNGYLHSHKRRLFSRAQNGLCQGRDLLARVGRFAAAEQQRLETGVLGAFKIFLPAVPYAQNLCRSQLQLLRGALENGGVRFGHPRLDRL